MKRELRPKKAVDYSDRASPLKKRSASASPRRKKERGGTLKRRRYRAESDSDSDAALVAAPQFESESDEHAHEHENRVVTNGRNRSSRSAVKSPTHKRTKAKAKPEEGDGKRTRTRRPPKEKEGSATEPKATTNIVKVHVDTKTNTQSTAKAAATKVQEKTTARANRTRPKLQQAESSPEQVQRAGTHRTTGATKLNDPAPPSSSQKAPTEESNQSQYLAQSTQVLDLKLNYDKLRSIRTIELEKLLKEAQELAEEEKQTYESLISKFKSQVTLLSKNLEEEEERHKQEVQGLRLEHDKRLDAMKRRQRETEDQNSALRESVTQQQQDIERLKRELKVKAAEKAAAGTANTESNLQLALTRSEKLLELYRLVTSIQIRLIEDEDGPPDACTEVSCIATDSATGRHFDFDLAIPDDEEQEVEFLAAEEQQNELQIPSYLQDELSFRRSELSKFTKTILNVVTRK